MRATGQRKGQHRLDQLNFVNGLAEEAGNTVGAFVSDWFKKNCLV